MSILREPFPKDMKVQTFDDLDKLCHGGEMICFGLLSPRTEITLSRPTLRQLKREVAKREKRLQ